jgi:hypothetical protein
MATTDNAAEVKKICSSTVNLIDDNPLGVDFAPLLSTQKGPDADGPIRIMRADFIKAREEQNLSP